MKDHLPGFRGMTLCGQVAVDDARIVADIAASGRPCRTCKAKAARRAARKAADLAAQDAAERFARTPLGQMLRGLILERLWRAPK